MSLLPSIPLGMQSRQRTQGTGIASLTFKDSVLRFRTNPNKIRFTYDTNRRIDSTYGGRVIQLLSAKIDDLVVVVESGAGGWEYYRQVSEFMKKMLVEQRDGTPGVFEYTTRGWKLGVFATSVPFGDSVGNVSYPLELVFKVQEDITGVLSENTLSSELSRLQEGIGWKRSQYNDPDYNSSSASNSPTTTTETSPSSTTPESPTAPPTTVTPPSTELYNPSNTAPGLNNPTGPFLPAP